MDISSLYMFPVLTASASYVPANPIKAWSRPLAAGENAEDDFVYTYFDLDASQHENVISKGAASVANVPAPVLAVAGQPVQASNATIVPVPVDLTKLPAGATVVQNGMAIFGGLPLIQLPAAPAPASTEDPNILRLVNGVNAILTALKLPTV